MIQPSKSLSHRDLRQSSSKVIYTYIYTYLYIYICVIYIYTQDMYILYIDISLSLSLSVFVHGQLATWYPYQFSTCSPGANLTGFASVNRPHEIVSKKASLLIIPMRRYMS